MENIQPVIKVRIIGGQAFLNMLQMQADRCTGYTDLAFDTTPGYTDTQAFPTAVTHWKYRAIYRVDDAQVGLWSETISVAVGG